MRVQVHRLRTTGPVVLTGCCPAEIAARLALADRDIDQTRHDLNRSRWSPNRTGLDTRSGRIVAKPLVSAGGPRARIRHSSTTIGIESRERGHPSIKAA